MAKTLALILGIILVLVGLMGFVPNSIVGMGAMFDTNAALDILYIIFGVVLVGAGLRMPAQSGLWLKIIGVLYLVLAVLGFMMSSPLLGLFEVNMATTWLHVVLGIVLVACGFSGKGGMKAMPTAPMASSMPPASGGTV